MVLVVGAGPTGLALACVLARSGADVRIVERSPEYPQGSRGKGLTPRTLEVLDDLGVIDEILASGRRHMPVRKYRGSEVVAELDPEADRVDTPATPYAAAVLIPQWRVEQILRARLAEWGVTVELGTSLDGFDADEDGVTAYLNGRAERVDYLVGCDGGRSTVRKVLGVPFEGHVPDVQQMAVGDVEVDGLSRDCWHQWLTPAGGIMICPLPGTDAFQVQAVHETADDGSILEPTLDRFQRTFDRIAGVPGVRLRNLTWRSTYRVNVRMVDRLRVGRVLLAGDSAHVHPIAGGLGMNTGIQDGYNLGWKLALVARGEARDRLLDTYQDERLPVAAALLEITSARLEAVLREIANRDGGDVLPAGGDLSQFRIGYPWSPLSRTTVEGPLRGGDRASDAPCPLGRLFDLYRGPHFTLLGLGLPVPDGLPAGLVHGYRLEPGPHLRDGYGWDRLVLVRPDGYVGLVTGDPAAVHCYLADVRDLPAGPAADPAADPLADGARGRAVAGAADGG